MTVSTTIESGVARVELNRPDVRNAINIESLEALDEALTQVEADGARAVVLAGRGVNFCAGADLALVKSAFAGNAAATLGPLVESLHRVIRHLRTLPMPVVAALEGPAVGAGMGLALAADLRVAGRSALLIPGYFAIGASPDGGVSYFLTRALGGTRAASLILRNQPLTAQDLLDSGLAEEVVDDGAAVAAATDLAASVAGSPPLALLRMRTLVDSATTNDMATQLDRERDLVAELWATTDFREGVGAFLERRRPTFTGS